MKFIVNYIKKVSKNAQYLLIPPNPKNVIMSTGFLRLQHCNRLDSWHDLKIHQLSMDMSMGGEVSVII